MSPIIDKPVTYGNNDVSINEEEYIKGVNRFIEIKPRELEQKASTSKKQGKFVEDKEPTLQQMKNHIRSAKAMTHFLSIMKGSARQTSYRN